jgi:hypothetical protein
MRSVTIDGVTYEAVKPASNRRVVCLTHGWTWIGEYSQEYVEGVDWVTLHNAQNVQRYTGVGIAGAINDPSGESVTLGTPLACAMRIPLASVIWTAEVPACQ